MKLIEMEEKPINNFGYTDSYNLFKQNLKIMPNDWVWRNNKLRYSINSQGYRAPEWNEIVWSNSILMFGCSFVYGVGIDDDQTCANQIELLTNTPVINLGHPACGNMLLWANSSIISYEKINPKAVVYVWTFPHRATQFLFDYKCINYGPSVKRDSFSCSWITNPQHNIEFLKYCIFNTSILWKCPVVHCSVDVESHKKIPDTILLTPFITDKGRDFNTIKDTSHPGPISNTKWARLIVNKLGI